MEHYFTPKPTSPSRLGILKCVLRGLSFEFFTSPGVFSYKKLDLGTRLLIESMILPKNGRILDMGCGYGPIGIVAAKIEPNLMVWMTDINRRAISLTKKNIELSCLKGIHVRAGELYKPVNDLKFNTILANPPISAGMRNVVKPLILGAYDHLAAGGNLQLVAQWNKGGKTIFSTMESRFGNIDTLARGAGYHVMKAEKE